MCAHVLFVWSQSTRLTDRQTDRGMDGWTESPRQYRLLLQVAKSYYYYYYYYYYY